MRIRKFYKGEGELGIVIVLAVLGLAVYGIYALSQTSGSGEQEGTVDYSDCRQKVELKDGDSKIQSRKFTCSYSKTSTGKIMSGSCISIEMENGKCVTAYMYEKKSEIICKDNEQVSYDGSCSCAYGFVNSRGVCVSKNQSCINSYGSYSYSNSYDNDSCYCNSGYVFNSNKTSCISAEPLTNGCKKTYGEGSYFTYKFEDGKSICGCLDDYVWNFRRDTCVTKESVDTSCKKSYGSDSYYLGYVKDSSYMCKSN